MGNPSTIYRRESDRFFPTPRPFVEKSASSAARERCGTALPTFLHGPPTSERRPSGTVPRRGTPVSRPASTAERRSKPDPPNTPRRRAGEGMSLGVHGVTAWNADFSRHPRAERAAEPHHAHHLHSPGWRGVLVIRSGTRTRARRPERPEHQLHSISIVRKLHLPPIVDLRQRRDGIEYGAQRIT